MSESEAEEAESDAIEMTGALALGVQEALAKRRGASLLCGLADCNRDPIHSGNMSCRFVFRFYAIFQSFHHQNLGSVK